MSRTLLSCVGQAKSVDTFLPTGLGALRMFERNGKVGAVRVVAFFHRVPHII